LLLAAAVLIAAGCTMALQLTVEAWTGQPEYSHGLIVPFLAAYLVWQRRSDLAPVVFRATWTGLPVVLAGCLLHAAGRLSALYVLEQYAMLLLVTGIVLATVGWPAVRTGGLLLLLLALSIPLPPFLLGSFSAQMQLLSSQLGVAVVRLFGISVYLEGNVIDLGSYQLQVAEACDGLRYLFPLLTLGLVMAYFFRAPLWQRLLVFASSVPITIAMNSFRIGLIGVSVEHWGVRMAEGFLHEFQGWVVFMASAALMVAEMALLARCSGRGGRLSDVFSLQPPPPLPREWPRLARPVPGALVAAVAILAVYDASLLLQPHRVESRQARVPFAAFPLHAGPWQGRANSLESIYLDALKLDDYVLADFRREASEPPVNLYVAWYDSQRAGQSAHSPRTCIPGGGWQIAELRTVKLAGIRVRDGALRVNRVVIQRGKDRQLVYYWFQQRGRVVTSEYLVKWYILVDALLRNRTDGALVRVITPIAPGEPETRADARLGQFVNAVMPGMPRYVPE
jgi:exosortase D (VPLPA-CTERM-specific)